MGELRTWAEALGRESTSAEARAASRAILLLADEVERLSAELEQARTDRPPDEPPTDDWPDDPAARRPSRFAALKKWLAAPVGPRRLDLRRRRALRRMVVALVALGALAFATLSLGARLSAPTLHAEGPASAPPGRSSRRSRAPRRATSAPTGARRARASRRRARRARRARARPAGARADV